MPPPPAVEHRDPDEFPISSHGRMRLLDTALVLFDEHGIDGVSARTIAQTAGHRNVAAVNYHFGSRDRLLRAVLARHAEGLDVVRHGLLDELEARGEPITPRDALSAILRPLVSLMRDPDGRRYLRLLNQAANHPAYVHEANIGFAASLARAAVHLAPMLQRLPDATRPHRAQNLIGAAVYALAEHARLIDDPTPARTPLEPDALHDELMAMMLGALDA